MAPKAKQNIKTLVGAQTVVDKLFPVWSDAASSLDKNSTGEPALANDASCVLPVRYRELPLNEYVDGVRAFPLPFKAPFCLLACNVASVPSPAKKANLRCSPSRWLLDFRLCLL
jgi:hypothetical protein